MMDTVERLVGRRELWRWQRRIWSNRRCRGSTYRLLSLRVGSSYKLTGLAQAFDFLGITNTCGLPVEAQRGHPPPASLGREMFQRHEPIEAEIPLKQI